MTGAVSFVVKIFTEASASVASVVVTALQVIDLKLVYDQRESDWCVGGLQCGILLIPMATSLRRSLSVLGEVVQWVKALPINYAPLVETCRCLRPIFFSFSIFLFHFTLPFQFSTQI